MDKYHGEGGSYEIDKVSGERRPIGSPQKRHPGGDRARDEKGAPIDAPQASTEPALPAAQPAPWAGADEQRTKAKKGG